MGGGASSSMSEQLVHVGGGCKVPRSMSEVIDPAFLDHALSLQTSIVRRGTTIYAAGRLNEALNKERRVSTCEQKPLIAQSAGGEALVDGGGMSGSTIKRLYLEQVVKDRAEVKTEQSSLVCKITNAQSLETLPIAVRLVTCLMRYHRWENLERETLFYKLLSPVVRDIGLRIPECKFCGEHRGRGADRLSATRIVLFDAKPALTQVLLLEDMKAAGFTVSFSPMSILTGPHARAAIRCMARLHAHFWRSGTTSTEPNGFLELKAVLGPDTALPNPGWQEANHLASSPFFRRVRKRTILSRGKSDAIRAALRRGWADVNPALHRQDLRECFDAMLLNATTLLDMWQTMDLAQTLVHGDMHGWNLLFKPGDLVPDEYCCILDWQIWGVGRAARELSWFLTFSQDATWENDVMLLRVYHEMLVEKWNPAKKTIPPSFDDLVVEFCAASLSKLLYVLITMATLSAKEVATDADGRGGDPKKKQFAIAFTISNTRVLRRAAYVFAQRNAFPAIGHLLFPKAA